MFALYVDLFWQVIAFLYTAMRSIDLGLRRVLIVTPVNVLHNWRQEFVKWAPSEYKPLRVFMLDDVARSILYFDLSILLYYELHTNQFTEIMNVPSAS